MADILKSGLAPLFKFPGVSWSPYLVVPSRSATQTRVNHQKYKLAVTGIKTYNKYIFMVLTISIWV